MSAEEEARPVYTDGPRLPGRQGAPHSPGFELRLAGIGPGIGGNVRRSVFWFQLSRPLTCLRSEAAPFPIQACFPSVTGPQDSHLPRPWSQGTCLPPSPRLSQVPSGQGHETWSYRASPSFQHQGRGGLETADRCQYLVSAASDVTWHSSGCQESA